ncbi:hypothetical protein BKA04_001430 [Cryobacterium mesophilum]|uniref:Mycothiol maleylpyruvate isomerase n=1 Tax=Terrimesophilobacter mesophilus TaxID=433647 RepID=A0A4R8V9U9_9MICO|nr:maleylpyruvate isomerase N-terminal domain-containing protein [Terrimesophilobacter mesophilus]MBB5633207.1 hypothetical protein [Terrimesophilobacter mesophilus]TFB79954.1 mycothiol maleylpyruvate isomerase [Terrimesophilobacter mesophilus]
MKNAAVFEQAAQAFLEILDRIEDRETEQPGGWELPGLGVWTVRGLAGHTSRAILTVSEYLAAPPPASVGCPDAETYIMGLSGGGADDAAIAARGFAAGEALGDDAVARLSRTLDHTLAAIAAQPANRIVSVAGGRTIPLTEYLRTRVFELVVHTIDLSRATGIPHALPARAIEDAACLAGRVAVRAGDGDTLLLAVTGRLPLPKYFSVV